MGKKIPIYKRILAVFGVLTILMIFLVAYNYTITQRIKDSLDFVGNVTLPNLQTVNEIVKNALLQELHLHHYWETRDPEERNYYLKKQRELHQVNTKLFNKLGESLYWDYEKEHLQHLLQLREEYDNLREQTIDPEISEPQLEVFEFNEEKLRPEFERYLNEIDQLSKLIIKFNQEVIYQTYKDVYYARITSNVMLFTISIVLLISTFIIYKIIKAQRKENEMLKASQKELEKLYNELEEKVDERTKELNKRNIELLDLQSAITENIQRLQFGMDAANLGVWEISSESGESRVDARYYEIFGYNEPLKEWNFEKFFSHIYPEDLEMVQNVHEKSGIKKAVNFETRIITADNKVKWIEVKGKPITDKKGEKKLFGVIADITDKKVHEIQKEDYIKLLKKYNEELEEITRAKDKFISVISHDLKNPLSVIVSSSDIILNNENIGHKELENFVNVINNSSKRVVKQLNELVERSKESGLKVSYSPTDKSLHEYVQVVLQVIESAAANKNIKITNKTPEDIWIYADPLMMQSVIQNLVTNSIKFTPEGGSISITGKVVENGMVEVRVKDSGVGMTEEVRKGIFEKDKTVTTLGTKKETGSGQGLKLVKEFVEKQGGTIRVESEPGKGTCFAFTIPQSKGNITIDQ